MCVILDIMSKIFYIHEMFLFIQITFVEKQSNVSASIKNTFLTTMKYTSTLTKKLVSFVLTRKQKHL